MTTLRAERVRKTYRSDAGDVTAVADVSLTVADREFVSVVGPSGCGKTTLLRLFAGLEAPTDGRVLVDGDRIEGPSPERAMVFQSFNLFDWRTVRGNVAFGLERRGVPEAERRERVDDWLDTVGLTDFADAYPDELSGGMRQRVGLARALAVDPDVLLMDEPFGALDAQTRAVLQSELLDLWEDRRTTVLFVTHDIEEALLLSDRVLVMGAAPNAVTRTVNVPFERPRHGRELETTPAFADYRREIWDHLRDEQ
ncbi:ABC transporter ATP-binding protein [Halarchaeum nitratireducens]|uniref:Molybdate/tungstate import ATP-binding protein WtpC n=1 Tax=Halarchaeum nitratireducens TaxID=489913 RepID=A0A830G8A0_9EURY|nr:MULTISPECIES: ABC transporter ATP-binding protein [Halarchaeum]MBP2249937.1 NitT/TauT family transport system ATP-binding protein [Halarchaeum solikamskense]GGN09659.1 nitrate ABC transporter ATP-binding protein [Halarchaeum nitratireducens]